jgi:hypothetical protein
MPKLKRAENKYERLQTTIYGKMEVLHMDYSMLGQKLGCCRQTAAGLVHDPERITLRLLPKFARALEIPAEELRALIPMN